MMVMMPVSGCRLVEMAFRAATGLILHLDGGVRNFVVMLKEVPNTFKQRIVIVGRNNLNVQRHKRFLTHQPDVNVVYVTDFRTGTTQIAF